MIHVFDIEADGLKPTKIHCVSYEDANGVIRSITDYNGMREFFTNSKTLIGHNIIRYDIPAIEKILGMKVKARLIDTLALSWYLEPDRSNHGLEGWGQELGFPKPPIDDWENLSIEEYVNRCESDVEINRLLWARFRKHLLSIYGEYKSADRLIRYLSFKMDCAREQEQVKWKLDIDLCKKSLSGIQKEKEAKVLELEAAMPKVPIYKTKTRPKKPYKQSGELSAIGQKWFDLLKEQKLPENFMGEIKIIDGYKEPNANSHGQIKDWLYSLGWKPITFKYNRNKETGDVKKIEQINLPHGGGICPSIQQLYEKHPELEVLEGLFVLGHRISILEGFLKNVDEEGYVYAGVAGLTNTLRFKHSVCVNLPGVDKPYGEIIRGCLTVEDGYELCGSDMSGLEDRTKQHYMWSYDPEYVKEMLSDDFDAHTSFAVFAGAMTPEEEIRHKEGDKSFKGIRKIYKAVNYACTYGAGGPTAARAAGVSEQEGRDLVAAYWKRNWSLEAIADDCEVKTVRGQMWLYNPVSGFYYSLRYKKDRFSTLNQGTGVYCFDTWVKHCRKLGRVICGQFHDEIITPNRIEERADVESDLFEAIRLANKELNLNVQLGIDIQFGSTYADIH